MRVFVTGASGFIGSALVPQLLSAGHEVLGLARSEASARAISAMGAQVLRGDLNDRASLEAGAARTEGVVHLGFIHDFGNWLASVETDRRAIEALGAALEGSRRPLVIASGLAGLTPGRTATEETPYDASANPRAATAVAMLALAERGVRISFVRLPPTVHGPRDHGFVKVLADVARAKGVAGYVGDGANRWPAGHVQDAARLFVSALEEAPPGGVLHAVAEEGIPARSIAEHLGRALGLPAASIAPEAAEAHFGWMARFFALDQPATSRLTRERYGWTPSQPGLLEDIDAGHYT
jgi:nucleoside-diphosphate-sugar epimerase